MDLSIRKMTLEDLPELMQWRMEVLRCVFDLKETDPAYPGLVSENEAYYKKMLAAGEHAACVVSIDGQEAGCGGICFYQEMPSPDNHSGKCAYYMNIYTRDAFRGKGVAKATMHWLTEEARAWGAEKIYLESSKMAIPFYKSLGFIDMHDYMKLPAES